MINVRRHVLIVGAICVIAPRLQGCAQGPSREGPVQAKDTMHARASSQDEEPSHDGFVDRRPEINPTPEEVTKRRFSILHAEIGKFEVLHGRLPDDLEEILSREEADPNLQPQARWLSDGWDRVIRYRVGDRYELRSAGADGVFGSEDDLISPHPRE